MCCLKAQGPIDNMDTFKKLLGPEYSKEEQMKARTVDLISLPSGLKERCSNCVFLNKNGYCTNGAVEFVIKDPENECCGLWDNNKIDRKKTQGEK